MVHKEAAYNDDVVRSIWQWLGVQIQCEPVNIERLCLCGLLCSRQRDLGDIHRVNLKPAARKKQGIAARPARDVECATLWKLR